MGFRRRTIRALAGASRRIRHLPEADSIGVDFHKTGFAPYISSLVLVKNFEDLRLVTRSTEQMPYLYHYRNIFRYVHSEAMAGRGVVVSSTDCYRRTRYQEPIFALKSYIQSPFVDESDIEVVVAKVLEARETVG